MGSPISAGLSLAPFRAMRFAVPSQRLGRLLCPPYDVISDAERADLLEQDPDNAVSFVLPRAADGEDAYTNAATRISDWLSAGLVRSDEVASLYVYEMHTADGSATRGLIGAVGLRQPADGVILPHENTMAGPVADRLALMVATEANLEPIYLVYDGGGAASEVVSAMDRDAPHGVDAPQGVLASARTPDGTTHRLWAVTDPQTLDAIAADLGSRRAMIADGHHRYATYLELQRRRNAEVGPGPWDRGLALLVDSSSYGLQVHAIHRVLPGLPFAEALSRIGSRASLADVATTREGLRAASEVSGFAAVLTDGVRNVLLTNLDAAMTTGLLEPGEPAAMGELDVTVLHRGLVGQLWGLKDEVGSVDYAHSVEEATEAARATGGTAILLRPTPVSAVAAVAAAGARMPRKSTLFTPKPASGIVMRRFADQVAE